MAHINDNESAKMYLDLIIKLSDEVGPGEKLYDVVVKAALTEAGLDFDAQRGASVGKPMSAASLNKRCKEIIEILKNHASHNGVSAEKIEAFSNAMKARRKNIIALPSVGGVDVSAYMDEFI